MRITFPFVPIEFEIKAGRRTEPLRFRVRTLMITVAMAAIVVYLRLPLSAADQRLMAHTFPKAAVGRGLATARHAMRMPGSVIRLHGRFALPVLRLMDPTISIARF